MSLGCAFACQAADLTGGVGFETAGGGTVAVHWDFFFFLGWGCGVCLEFGNLFVCLCLSVLGSSDPVLVFCFLFSVFCFLFSLFWFCEVECWFGEKGAGNKKEE